MPSLAKRPCSVCGVLCASGRCAEHSQAKQAERETTAGRGYGAAHKRLRVMCFERDEWRCVDCGWEPLIVKDFREAGVPAPSTDLILKQLGVAYARKEQHLHADHQVPIEDNPELALDLDNLRTRCNHCHNAKTAREDGGFGRGFHSRNAAKQSEKSSVFGSKPQSFGRSADVCNVNAQEAAC